MLTRITEYQAKVYRVWLESNKNVKLTAKFLEIQPEKVRKIIGRVEWKMGKGEKLS
jgi:hypothetical protein